MRRKYKLFLAMFLILAMLLQAHAVYATEGRKEIPNSSLSGVLPAEKTEASVETSANMGNIFGLENGKSYYIMNVGTGTILGVRSLNDADGNRICMRDRQELTNRQWKVSVCENDTGILQWNDSSTNKVMTFSNGEFVLSSNVNDPISQVFMIDRIEAGQYQGLYRIRLNYHYLALSSNSRAYPQLTTTFDAYSVWAFMAVDKWYADVFDFEYPAGEISPNPTNSTEFSNDFLSFAEDWGYLTDTTAGINNNTNASASFAYNCMKSTTEIMIYRGHGMPGCLAFGNEEGLYNGILSAVFGNLNFLIPIQGDTTMFSVEALEENSLAHMRCVIYNGCETGLSIENTDYNLVDATFEKGAHYVLGVTEDLNVAWEKAWFYYLISYLNSSYSVGEAVANATDEFSEIEWYFEDTGEYIQQPYPYYAVGDGYQYLSFNES